MKTIRQKMKKNTFRHKTQMQYRFIYLADDNPAVYINALHLFSKRNHRVTVTKWKILLTGIGKIHETAAIKNLNF
jgi:hypothetical protein